MKFETNEIDGVVDPYDLEGPLKAISESITKAAQDVFCHNINNADCYLSLPTEGSRTSKELEFRVKFPNNDFASLHVSILKLVQEEVDYLVEDYQENAPKEDIGMLNKSAGELEQMAIILRDAAKTIAKKAGVEEM